MSKTNISVSEADIDDALIKQHQASGKTVTFKVPKMPRIRRPAFKFSALKVLVIIVILAGAAGGYVYQTRRVAALKRENARLANPQAAAQDEARHVKDQVAKLIELPNEDPTIATVVDVEKLKTQPFFTNAQNGDRVLLFANAKKAILYRPGDNKIVEVAPINVGDGTASSGGTGNATSGVAGTSTTQNKTTTTPIKKP